MPHLVSLLLCVSAMTSQIVLRTGFGFLSSLWELLPLTTDAEVAAVFPEEDRLPREGEAGSISTRNLHKKPQCKRSLKGFWMAWGRLVCTYLCASCDIRAPRYCSHKSPSSKAWTQEYKAEYDGGGVGAALRHTVLLQYA